PGSPLYNIPAAVRLTGALDQAALQRSFDAIVARHAVLRTTFHTNSDQQPVQVIAPPAPVALPTVDLRHLPVADREAAARRLAEQEALQPFDLGRGPLLRVTLLQLADTAHVVLVTMHHSISDGWSVGVVIRELALTYPAFARGDAPVLPDLPIQYVDFAVWQREWLSGAVLDAQLAYWQQQLAGAPTVLDLPIDRPRPAVQSFHGTTLPFRLPLALSQQLHTLSQREGATLFMTLLAGWYTLLFRYTGQHDILVGSPIANRNRHEIEPLIGFFGNTLVLRGDLHGNPSFRTLLGRVRQMALGAFAHQDLPFEMLVEAVQSERDLSRNPLFQVMFVLQNAPAEPLELPGLTLEPLTPDTSTAKFDLTLGIIEQADGLTGELEYNTDLFDATTMVRLLGHFQSMLDGVVADPDQPISSLALLTDAEQQQLLIAWNATATPFPHDLCLPQLVEVQAAQRPDALAVTCADRSLTYRQLDRQANQLAHHLQALGVGPDVCVGLHLTRSLDFVIGALAVLKAGGAYLPLDPAYPPERMAFMLEDAQAPILLTQHQLPEVVPSHTLHRIYLDRDWSTIAEQPETLPRSLATADHLAYVIYTSGSTGVPKGVGVPHRGALNLVTWHQRTYDLTPKDRASLLAGLAFDASVWEIWPYLASGASLHLPAEDIRSAPGALVEWLIAQEITLCFMPTPLAEAVIAEPLAERLRLRALLTGGDVLHNQEWSRLAFPVINHYGPTENTVVTTCGEVEDSSTPLPTIGRPIANTQVYLLDTYGQPVPISVAGELYIGGASLARGYLDRPALTAEKFVPHPFAGQAGIPTGARLYRSGDLARYLSDGTIEFIGRIDQQVKIRGFRIEIGEIEAALLRYPDVRDVVVVVREDSPSISEHGAKRLVAYLVTDTTPAPTLSELRSFLQTSLPDYMVPAAFVYLDALPLTPNGKIDRKALPAPEANRAELEQTFVAPRTATEALLVDLWSDVLGTNQLGVHDNFFAIGGHSLLATQVVSRVRSAVAVDLPLREVFAAPTVAELAARIDALRADDQVQDDAPPLQPTDRSGPQPLSFSQERLWFLDQLEPNSPLYIIPSVLRVAGYLDTSAFEWSLNAIISRHEILRTTFTLVAGKPVQVVAPPTPINISSVDLRSLPPDEREAAARELVSTEALLPFNLQRGPLLRVTLLQLADTEHIVVFTTHHIISDGWSVGVIVGELGQLYSAFTRGEEPALPELPIQYADFAVWQRSWLQGAALERQLGYWQHQLGSRNSRGPVPLLDLPTDRPRPAVQSYSGNNITWTLPQSLTDAVHALSQREQVTPFMTLLAAFQVLLFRYSGQDDIAVGTPIANRNRREIEPLIGCFINTLVLRTDLSGAPSFQALLGRVRQSTLGAYDHQDLPFEVLVDTLQPTRQLSYNPLFQVMFVMQNTPAQGLDLPDIQLSLVEIETSTAKTDLSLEIVPIGDTLVSSFVYNTDLFDQATIERMIGHFETVLAGIVADPTQAITSLPLLTPAEQQALLVDWNATADFYPG
ncbi:MAG: amino acid adenylation domain-containing protein, partial [Chloroflexi bacterium]|nr:amino acid adenylation domain-containing protein [Chloroflexota bacterium]